MYSYVAALAIAGSASGLVLPRQDGCCFQMNASGGKSGSIGQLDDGQNRIGGDYSPATYCINDGTITDSNGRGCILTPPTTQLQCDEGATPTEGFSVSGEGEVQYNGSNKFYACGADKDEYNIYTKPVEGQDDCVEVTLSSSEGKCSGNGGGEGEGASSSAPAPAGSSAASTKPANGQSTAPAESGASKPSGSAPASSPATGGGEKPSNSAPQGYNSQQPSAPASSPATGSGEKPSGSAPAPSGPAETAPAPSAPASAPSAPASAPSAPAESAPAECKPETVTVTVTQSCAGSQETGNSGAPGNGSPAPSMGGPGSGSGSPQPSGGAGNGNTGVSGGGSPAPTSGAGGSGPSSYGNSQPSGGAKPSGDVPNGGAPSAEGSKPAASVPVTSEASQPSMPAGNTAPVPGSSKAVPSVGSGSGSPATSSKPSASAPAPYPTGSSAKESSAPVGTGAASSTQGTGTASGSACQTDLSGAYQTPHLIVPVSSEQPDKAYGTDYNGQINETTSTIFNFDIPQDYEGKQCSIIFLFPKKEDLETSSYEFGGSGSLSCSELSSAADEQTSYSNAPSVESDLGTIDLQTGNSYVVATQDCKAGTTQSIELSSENGLSLNFFEDWNPSPLGLYITSC